MATFALTFLFVILAVAGLAAGVFAGRAPIRGSCGGIACQKRISCQACKLRTPPEDSR